MGALISGNVDAPAPTDWTPGQIGWIFSIAIVLLGLSAAIFGKWLERVGPRKAMMAAALCFGGGFLIGALGMHLHSLVLLYLGYGVLGGIGLGLGYISPVSTLIKWFPDRKGVATGMAIMGFGGGAMIASPLSVALMAHFKETGTLGVAATFITLGIIYFLFMQFGVWTIRVPADDWAPAGYVPNAEHSALITSRQRIGRQRHQDAAVLAAVGGAHDQRNGRHRRARNGFAAHSGHVFESRHGRRQVGDGRRGGGLRGPAQLVQPAGPLLLVVGIG